MNSRYILLLYNFVQTKGTLLYQVKDWKSCK